MPPGNSKGLCSRLGCCHSAPCHSPRFKEGGGFLGYRSAPTHANRTGCGAASLCPPACALFIPEEVGASNLGCKGLRGPLLWRCLWMGCFSNLPCDPYTGCRVVKPSSCRAGGWAGGGTGHRVAGLVWIAVHFVQSLFTHFYPFFFPLIFAFAFFLGKHEFSLSFLTCEISFSLGFVSWRGDRACTQVKRGKNNFF